MTKGQRIHHKLGNAQRERLPGLTKVANDSASTHGRILLWSQRVLASSKRFLAQRPPGTKAARKAARKELGLS